MLKGERMSFSNILSSPPNDTFQLFIVVSLLVIARVSLLSETACHFRSPDSVRFTTDDTLAIQPLSVNVGQFSFLHNVVQSFRTPILETSPTLSKTLAKEMQDTRPAFLEPYTGASI